MRTNNDGVGAGGLIDATLLGCRGLVEAMLFGRFDLRLDYLSLLAITITWWRW